MVHLFYVPLEQECSDRLAKALSAEQVFILLSMIFILKPKSYKLEFYERWSFNMVSELGLTGGPKFELPL